MKKIISSVLLIFLLSINFLAISSVVAQPSEKLPVIIRFNGKTDVALIRAHGGDIKHEYTIISAIACSLPEQAIDALTRNPNIEKIEPDGIVYAIEQTTDWGVTQIGADLVHEQENTGAGVKVAIIDTGIDRYHPDLNDNYEEGWDFVNNDDDPMDDAGHGTHCAGIVAAEDNDFGVIGVAPGALLYAVKVLDATGSGYVSDVIAGIEWSVDNRMQIISMSLGADSDNELLHEACNAAYTEGVLVVAAAGNDYRANRRIEWDTVDYPARYDSVIAVGATDDEDTKASWSSTGLTLELAAPGVTILSTYPGETYVEKSGTSMACPHVVGTAALVWAAEPSLTNVQVRVRLQETAYDLDSAGWDSWYGYGLVDADEAAAAPGVETTPPTISDLTPADEAIINTAIPTISATVTDASGINEDSIVMTLDEVTVTHTYDSNTDLVYYVVPTAKPLAEGDHIVTLQVSDRAGNLATKTWSFTVDTTPPATPVIEASIFVEITSRSAGRNTFYRATATVTVTDTIQEPVEGVTVYGHWEGATSDSDMGITDAYGIVMLTSDSVKSTAEPTFDFVIDEIALS